MTYKPKSKDWFRKRIGKKIYRNDNNCPCPSCKGVTENGLYIKTEQEAEYLAMTDSEFASCGTYLNYRDKK